MITIVGVRFRGSGKAYYFDPGEFDIRSGMNVVVETARGIEFGTAAGDIRQVHEEAVTAPLKRVLRIATLEDVEKAQQNRIKEREAIVICKEKIRKHELEMKLIDAEYSFDGTKILFYFTADGRIDFRGLVKDLASVFRTRIELRQIGVRDETKILGGMGICGRPLCCSTWLTDFVPVSIRMAKEQNLSLNPTKISGTCGRLMCCLKNEQATYEYLNSKLPSVGERVRAFSGEEGVVSSVSVLRQRVRVVIDMGEEKEMKEFDVSELEFAGKPKKRRDGENKDRKGDTREAEGKDRRGETREAEGKERRGDFREAEGKERREAYRGAEDAAFTAGIRRMEDEMSGNEPGGTEDIVFEEAFSEADSGDFVGVISETEEAASVFTEEIHETESQDYDWDFRETEDFAETVETVETAAVREEIITEKEKKGNGKSGKKGPDKNRPENGKSGKKGPDKNRPENGKPGKENFGKDGSGKDRTGNGKPGKENQDKNRAGNGKPEKGNREKDRSGKDRPGKDKANGSGKESYGKDGSGKDRAGNGKPGKEKADRNNNERTESGKTGGREYSGNSAEEKEGSAGKRQRKHRRFGGFRKKEKNAAEKSAMPEKS